MSISIKKFYFLIRKLLKSGFVANVKCCKKPGLGVLHHKLWKKPHKDV